MKLKLKREEPWEYDALYGDPVTGRTDTGDDGGCLVIIFIGLIALGVWGLVNYLISVI